MSNEIEKAMEALRALQVDAALSQVDAIRRRAMYPDLAAMDARTNQISMAQAKLPVAETDEEKVHLICHIDMLRKELRKRDAQAGGSA